MNVHRPRLDQDARAPFSDAAVYRASTDESLGRRVDGTQQTLLLQARGVGKSFSRGGRRVTALSDVDLDIYAGSFLSIVGRSGCGKSTLLRLFAGLLKPSAGDLLVDGEPVTEPPAAMRCVFQDYSQSLLPWSTVERNVRFGAQHGFVRASQEAISERAIARDALERVGLAHVSDRYPWELSGGMQQRVAIARALAARPKVLLMDEPFSSVDALSRTELQDAILAVRQQLKSTVVFVTHDIDEAVYLSDRIIVLNEQGAGILADIKIDLPYPRDQIETRESPEYLRLRRQVATLVLSRNGAGQVGRA